MQKKNMMFDIQTTMVPPIDYLNINDDIKWTRGSEIDVDDTGSKDV